MTQGPGCPFLNAGQRRGKVLGWMLSAATVALTLSGLGALAMTARPAGESMGEEPVTILMLPAAHALAAMSDPAPVTAADAPDQPEPETEAEDAPKVPQVDEALVRPDLIAATDIPDADVAPTLDQPPPPPEPAELAEAEAPPEPKPEPKPEPALKSAPKAKEKPKEKKETPEATKKAEKPVKKEAAKPKAKEDLAGAAASAPSTEKKAAASAGKGKKAVANYGASVMKKIRKTKKAKAPARGMVVVGFSIADSGELASVKVLRSSGSADLDQVALDHIRRSAPFPAPPPGANRMLSFEFVSKG